MDVSDFTKSQLIEILSALDGAPRNPANKAAALRAIGRHALCLGLTAEMVLAAAPGLLNGRLTAASWVRGLNREPELPIACGRLVEATATIEAELEGPTTGVTTGPEAVVTPRPGRRDGTKQARLIALLQRPEGAAIDEIAATLTWQRHTVRGAIAGALKKKLGLRIEAEQVDGRGRVYRLLADAVSR